jgi:hypothetical protein
MHDADAPGAVGDERVLSDAVHGETMASWRS